MKRYFLPVVVALLAPAAKATLVEQAQVVPAEGEVWWGYWNSSQGMVPVASYMAGGNVSCIRVLATTAPQLVDARLRAIRFYISDKTSVTAARVWVSVAKPGGAVEPDVVSVEIDAAALRDVVHDGAPTEVELPEAVTLLPSTNRYASAYIGFTLTVAGSGTLCEMMATGVGSTVVNSNIYGTNNLWGTYGALAMQLLVSSERIAGTGVAVAAPEALTVLAGEETTVELACTVDGSAAVREVDYVVWMEEGGAATESPRAIEKGHYEVTGGYGGEGNGREGNGGEGGIDEWGAVFRVPVAVRMPEEAQRTRYWVEVTQVNGVANESAGAVSPSARATLLERMGTRRVVMEEATATWCNNCTRGIVGMRLLEERFGDRFIGIAMHGSDDPMLLPEYRTSRIGRKMPALPICYLDRAVQCDPYMGQGYEMHFTTDALVEARMAVPAVADIALTAQWADAAQTTMAVEAQTTFHYADTEAPYGIVLLLTEDGMSGEGTEWTQINGYSYTQSKSEGLDEDMQEFVNAPYRITGMAYNHVAVAVAGADDGVAGSIAAPLVSGRPQRFTMQWDLADNTLIQNRERLHAVALLVDRETTEVVNAARAEVSGFGGDGIRGIEMDGGRGGYAGRAEGYAATESPRAVYDLQGRRVQGSIGEQAGSIGKQAGSIGEQAGRLRPGIYIVGGKKLYIF